VKERAPTGEAVQVDGPQQLVEAGTVLGVLRKVLVDHVERGLKHGIQNGWNLRNKNSLGIYVSIYAGWRVLSYR
jgi:hypothetical protein